MSQQINKDKILQVAYDQFAELGYSATSIRSIADKLDISTGLIFHHFTSKEGLWLSVERFVLQDNLTQDISIRQDNLQHFIEDIVNYRLEFYKDKKFRRFFHWRALELGSENFIKNIGLQESIAPNPFVIHKYITQLQKNKIIRQDLDAHVIATMIFGCTAYSIWDYVAYYKIPTKQMVEYKSFVIKSLMNLLA